MTQRAIVQIERPDGTRRVEVKGRDLWALGQLELRRMGLEIETIQEAHNGAFPGTHARYVLHSSVRIEQVSEPEAVT
jgi:hypothetical protein